MAWAKGLFIALALVDWSQTRDIHATERGETNTLIRPFTEEGINVSVGLAVASTMLAVELLPSPWNERLLFTAIGVELNSIRHNASFGVRVVW